MQLLPRRLFYLNLAAISCWRLVAASFWNDMARGLIANTAGNALFIVVEDAVYSVNGLGVRTQIGTLVSRRGHVGMKIGLTQLVIVDGPNGYVYDLNSGVFGQITSPAWQGSNTVEYLGGFFSFIDPNSQEFYISAIEDALTLDALDFATANNSPDKLVGQITTSNVIVYMGQTSGEIWQLDPVATDFAFERNNGATLEVGLMSAFTVKELDNSVFWLGQDERGGGTVYKMQGFSPVRVSTMAVEQVIQQSIQDGNDITKACAYTYQQDGHSFYCLQVPGLDTTWVYDAASQEWHERAELIDGLYAQHRGNYHAYCYGLHLITGDDDAIYAYDPNANTNAGDPLVRDRVSPHYATPQLERNFFNIFELDCTVGYGKAGQDNAVVQLRYSNDGGFSWSSWRTAPLGAVGQRLTRARFTRCGSARDRVWEVRCTDDTPFAIIAANIQ